MDISILISKAEGAIAVLTRVCHKEPRLIIIDSLESALLLTVWSWTDRYNTPVHHSFVPLKCDHSFDAFVQTLAWKIGKENAHFSNVLSWPCCGHMFLGCDREMRGFTLRLVHYTPAISDSGHILSGHIVCGLWSRPQGSKRDPK